MNSSQFKIQVQYIVNIAFAKKKSWHLYDNEYLP